MVKREKYIKILIDELIRTKNVKYLQSHRFEPNDVKMFLVSTFQRIDGLVSHRESVTGERMAPNQSPASILVHQLSQRLPSMTLP